MGQVAKPILLSVSYRIRHKDCHSHARTIGPQRLLVAALSTMKLAGAIVLLVTIHAHRIRYDALREAILAAWNAAPETYLSELLKSIPARFQAVIDANGEAY